MATNVNTMNLSDNGDGMVPLNDNRSTVFIDNRASQEQEKNVGQNKQTMDSTPINDIMMDPPMMMEEPRMQGVMPQMTAPNPQGAFMAQRWPPVVIVDFAGGLYYLMELKRETLFD